MCFHSFFVAMISWVDLICTETLCERSEPEVEIANLGVWILQVESDGL